MRNPILYEERHYREFDTSDRFVAFQVTVESTDLYVKAKTDLSALTKNLVETARAQVKEVITRRGAFLTSLEPIPESFNAGEVPLDMLRASAKVGTGPMAAVAGAIAQYVGRRLLEHSPEVIVENGGDIFIKVDHSIIVGIHAGAAPLSGKLGIRVDAVPIPLGICASSATVGPSLSLGRADAAVVIAKNTALADACATALGNRVKKASDLESGVKWAMSINGIDAALVILGEKLAVMGDIELVDTHSD